MVFSKQKQSIRSSLTSMSIGISPDIITFKPVDRGMPFAAKSEISSVS